MTLTLNDATFLQQKAADPSESKQVNANAGSGKTKVLVDRVSRLLLQGTDPDKILCLTYTRAAASEMQQRLFETLSKWSVASERDLAKAMESLFGKPLAEISPPIDLSNVRTLFASALETPEGLKVMTIHAFCDQVIRRFPIEAGILPGFEAIEDAEIDRLIKECRTRLFKTAQSDPELGGALHTLTLKMADATLEGLLRRAALDHERIERWQDSGGVSGFREQTGIVSDDTPEDIASSAWENTDKDRLRAFADLCLIADNLAQTRRVRGGIISALSETDPAKAFELYTSPLRRADGAFTKFPAKAVTDKDDFLTARSDEILRLETAATRMRAAKIADLSEAVLTVASWMSEDYQRAKRAERAMDFNDLIYLTRDLLTRKAVADWVSYKLDGGIEHILLDEAQDTSPDQWAIIDALAEPFSQESPDRDAPPRTFFAVGDPKQSIYRFQGAAPAIFIESFRTREMAEEIRLRMSFRSAQAVLDVVDGVFIEQGGLHAMFDAESVPETSDQIRHVAHRSDAGTVELWPIVPKSEKPDDKEAWDTTPLDARGDGDPRVRLATKIAETIKAGIDQGEAIYDRELKQHRPMHAGDVLILVQKRVGGLFEALIRELKRADLPVAGADRLILQEATIVRDLLSLTRFVLLPSDDLSLAEVLKSPLFGLTDDDLFRLCVDRGQQTLWATVQRRDPELAQALTVSLQARFDAPFDFYAKLLDRKERSGITYREALLRRLGRDAEEALDAFLSQALTFQQTHPPSLHGFLQRFTGETVEIKRDKDPAGGEVRIMTVHGAKGLEAPIVFLPDTTRGPRAGQSGLVDADEGLIYAPSANQSIPLIDTYKEREKIEDEREYMRLLYVAMTRAETKLIICGHWNGNLKEGYQEGSWYDWALRSFSALETTQFETPFDDGEAKGLRFGPAGTAAASEAEDTERSLEELPDWIDRPAQNARPNERSATPSSLLRRDDPSGRRPGRARPTRGIAIHKLLELLPDYPPAQRAGLGETLLDRYRDLDEVERSVIIDEVIRVLEDPAFEPIFSQGSRAEVSLAGRVETIHAGAVFMSAQVDRLAIEPDRITLVDYKSNREVPDTVEGVDPGYIAQLAAYRELAKTIWPEREIRCGLLWTQAPRLMWFPDPVLDAILTQVNALPTSVETV